MNMFSFLLQIFFYNCRNIVHIIGLIIKRVCIVSIILYSKNIFVEQVEEGEYMLAVWRRLAEAAAAGARVVVALLEPHHAAPFLQTAAALRARGLLQQGDLVFIMAQSPWPFIKNE